MNNTIVTGYQVTLLPIALEHQSLLRQWRNSPEIKQCMFSDETISDAQQLTWFEQVKECENQWHWIVSYRGTFIGSTNIKATEESASVNESPELEAGLYIGEGRYKNNILAFAPTLAMYDYCFEQFNTQHFKARVKATNSAAIHYNQKLGYKTIRTEEQGSVLEMLLTYNDYQSSTKMLKQFLSRSSKK
ncbi:MULTISPECIES: GNAT family N-acetyltransferase [Alteromonas]|mgnify:FL=1|uniref:GNAT family N-acetyltransferase n=1 Tax=Alteromonas TaxID=226 RepID=UPI0018CB4C87|nr:MULTISPECIES: GNAT family N-acetyltransferase [Alteromonas]QPL49143.1 GNAT family N-acetyltransferase [Alteromonas sp. B31-7]|tara:strand:+ start:2138 stop:2704 length:567 start_codon:yes stop_codon:yes gene_type:complete